MIKIGSHSHCQILALSLKHTNCDLRATLNDFVDLKDKYDAQMFQKVP